METTEKRKRQRVKPILKDIVVREDGDYTEEEKQIWNDWMLYLTKADDIMDQCISTGNIQMLKKVIQHCEANKRKAIRELIYQENIDKYEKMEW